MKVGLGICQQLGVLLKAQTRGLLFELHFRDALAQRVKLPFQLQATFVTGSQFGAQVVILAAFGTQVCFTLEFDSQRALQAGLCRRIAQTRKLVFGALLFVGQRGCLLRGHLNGAGQFFATRGQAAQRKLRLLHLPLQ